jgi:hypothetical protein
MPKVRITKGVKPAEITEIENAISEGNIPNVYSNNFSFVLGTGDIIVLLKNTIHPVAVLNLSYTGAKTLSIQLNDLINHLETATGNKIMTTMDIGDAFQSIEPQKVTKGKK